MSSARISVRESSALSTSATSRSISVRCSSTRAWSRTASARARTADSSAARRRFSARRSAAAPSTAARSVSAARIAASASSTHPSGRCSHNRPTSSTSSGDAPAAIRLRNTSSASIDRRKRPSAPEGTRGLPKNRRSSLGTAMGGLRRCVSSAISTANSIALRRCRCSISAPSLMLQRYPSPPFPTGDVPRSHCRTHHRNLLDLARSAGRSQQISG